MMGLRSQLSWMVKGQVVTQATLESLTRDLQALQLKVADIETHVGALAKELPLLRDRQLDEFDKVRTAVAGATDDLMARVENLRQQIEHR
jgi:predicted  nucleic acid-binding Zn-ribbon protein